VVILFMYPFRWKGGQPFGSRRMPSNSGAFPQAKLPTSLWFGRLYCDPQDGRGDRCPNPDTVDQSRISPGHFVCAGIFQNVLCRMKWTAFYLIIEFDRSIPVT